MIKTLLILSGTLSLSIGIIGLFMPVLPSTPFFILSSGLYVRSSPALYSKIAGNKLYQKYIRKQTGTYNPVTLAAAILIMWLAIILTISLIENDPLTVSLLFIAGAAGTFFKLRLMIRQIRNSRNITDKTTRT
jgi:uncharacterized membrane protein YbaN (DUF454 family)